MAVRTEGYGSDESRRRALALGGVVGVLIYWATVLILGSLDPDYSHIEHAMSTVGSVQAPYSEFGRAAFILEGLLLAAFSVGLYRELRSGRVETAGVSMITIHGIGRIGEGVFAWNNLQLGSFTNTPHLVLSVPGVLAMVVAPVLLAWAFRMDDRWQGYYRPTVAVAVLFIGVFIVLGPLSATRLIEIPPGLGQRMGFGIWYVWFIGLAANHYRRSPSVE